jgi:hypothetical protein
MNLDQEIILLIFLNLWAKILDAPRNKWLTELLSESW